MIIGVVFALLLFIGVLLLLSPRVEEVTPPETALLIFILNQSEASIKEGVDITAEGLGNYFSKILWHTITYFPSKVEGIKEARLIELGSKLATNYLQVFLDTNCELHLLLFFENQIKRAAKR